MSNQQIYIVGRGWTAALLTGSGQKKRKLNPEAAQDQSQVYRQEIESLKAQLQSSLGQLSDAQAHIQSQENREGEEQTVQMFDI